MSGTNGGSIWNGGTDNVSVMPNKTPNEKMRFLQLLDWLVAASCKDPSFTVVKQNHKSQEKITLPTPARCSNVIIFCDKFLQTDNPECLLTKKIALIIPGLSTVLFYSFCNVNLM